VVAVTIFSAILLSCHKEKPTLQTIKPSIKKSTRTTEDVIIFNNASYQISNGMLNFSTFAHYEKLYEVENPNTLMEFAERVKNSTAMISYIETISNIDENDRLHFIGSIVNEHGLIKIDDFILLLDFNSKLIYATKSGSQQDLINAQTGVLSQNVFVLNMEGEETIDALHEIKTRGLFCKESYATSKFKNNENDKLLTDNKSFVITARYSQFGIYYELMSLQLSTPNGSHAHFHCFTSGWWQRRCSNVSGIINQTLNFAPGLNTLNSNTLWYGNLRALKHYSVTMVVSSNNSIPAGDSKIININD
jgi:hypothetical protein